MVEDNGLNNISYYLMLKERNLADIVTCPICGEVITMENFGQGGDKGDVVIFSAIEFHPSAFGIYYAEVNRLSETPCNNVIAHEECILDNILDTEKFNPKIMEYLSTTYDKGLVEKTHAFLAKLEHISKLSFSAQVRTYEEQLRESTLDMISELEMLTPYPMVGSFGKASVR